MLRSALQLDTYKIQATDGLIGHVEDIYFDDDTWLVRYVAVNTGTWLAARKVLISPVALGRPSQDERVLPVNLTKEQIQLGPDIDTEKPISRQREAELLNHYKWPWPAYWTYPPEAEHHPYPYTLTPKEITAQKQAELKEKVRVSEEQGNPHLRSVQEVINYHVHAVDGQIGHVEDFILDDDTWAILYAVVNTEKWLENNKVLVTVQMIDKISWADSEIVVDLTQEVIRNGPEYDPKMPLNPAYEARLHDYYNQANH